MYLPGGSLIWTYSNSSTLGWARHRKLDLPPRRLILWARRAKTPPMRTYSLPQNTDSQANLNV